MSAAAKTAKPASKLASVEPAFVADDLGAVHAAFCASTARRLNPRKFGRELPLPGTFDADAEQLAKLIEAEDFGNSRKRAPDKITTHCEGAAVILARNATLAPPMFVPSARREPIEPLLELGADTAVEAVTANSGEECLPLGISLEYLFAAYNVVAVGRLARKWAAAAPQNLRASGPRELWPKMLECFNIREIFSLLMWGFVVAKKVGHFSPYRPQFRAALYGYLLVRDGADLFTYGAETIQILCGEVAECISASECYRELCTAYRRAAN